MKIRPMGAEFHADGRTDGYDEVSGSRALIQTAVRASLHYIKLCTLQSASCNVIPCVVSPMSCPYTLYKSSSPHSAI
jgi:hypothetical protein